jgi:hypothetical protein
VESQGICVVLLTNHGGFDARVTDKVGQCGQPQSKFVARRSRHCLASRLRQSRIGVLNVSMIGQILSFDRGLAPLKGITGKKWPMMSPAIALLVLLAWNVVAGRRIWRSAEVPVAFWSWRLEIPSQNEVNEAVQQTGAKTLFLRAGQIDSEATKVRRIRAATGSYPKDIDIHLVYNATRSCLAEFERLDPSTFAAIIFGAYEEDSQRAFRDGAKVGGVQLDIDVPTRLLRNYTKVLKATRDLLPGNSRLSITGLPTWMDSVDLRETLAAVDFWIPQCYGATIPQSLEREQPISSPKLVANAVRRARQLNRPFYAGLAAYGYAIQYAPDGSLIAVRGDLDPAIVVNNADLEMISRARFEERSDPQSESEWRYLYRARTGCVVAGTALRQGDYLMLDLPTSEALRASARAVREEGGDQLRGICVFRLPLQNDRTTLSPRQVASALADTEPASSFYIDVSCEQQFDHNSASFWRLSLTIINDGAASSRLGDGAMSLTLMVPPGSVQAINRRGFASSNFQCEAIPSDYRRDQTSVLQMCSLRRASVLEVHAKAWSPGTQAAVTLAFSRKPPEMIRAFFGVTLDDGRELQEIRMLDLRNVKTL